MKIFMALFVLSLTSVQAQVFPSSVEGLTIPNSHDLSEGEGKIFRGSEPRSKISELSDLGITNVLIFKSETKDEVTKEISALTELGYEAKNIKSIPFAWKDITDEVAACEQIIEGLDFIGKVLADESKSLYFHCTVGEDRTGLLAGLHRIQNQDWSIDQAFSDELCLNGFAHGNPKKPSHVAQAVRVSLTPLFLKVGKMIEASKVSKKKLTKAMCKSIASIEIPATLPKCSASTRAR